MVNNANVINGRLHTCHIQGSLKYTAKLLFHRASSVNFQTQSLHCDWTVTIVNVGNCQQHGDYTGIHYSATVLPTVIISHYTVTVQSQFSDCAQQVTDGIGILLCMLLPVCETFQIINIQNGICSDNYDIQSGYLSQVTLSFTTLLKVVLLSLSLLKHLF